MPDTNRYDALMLYTLIKRDIAQQRRTIYLRGLFYLLVAVVLVPFALWLFLVLLYHADLPFFDHSLEGVAACTPYFLVPFVILLVYYFYAMQKRYPKRLFRQSRYITKTLLSFGAVPVLTLLGYVIDAKVWIVLLFALAFVATVYYLSLIYYDIPLGEAMSIHEPLYRSDDLGWATPMGMLDNPFTTRDDENRARFFVQTSTLGVDIVAEFLFLGMRDTLLFYRASSQKRTLQEAARWLDVYAENDGEGSLPAVMPEVKVLLEALGYVSFRQGRAALLAEGQSIIQKAMRTGDLSHRSGS